MNHDSVGGSPNEKATTARWRNVFEELAAQIGNKKATFAIARRSLLVIYAILRDGHTYQIPAASKAA